MVDGGVVIGGTATDVAGPSVSAVSVTVSPVVISEVDTGPGGAGVGSWAALVSLNATLSPAIAKTAPAPTPAAASVNCLVLTSDHLIRSRSQQHDGVIPDPSTRRVAEAVHGET